MAMLYSSLEYQVYSRDGKVMKYLVEPVYSDLALGYCISGPEPTIILRVAQLTVVFG